MRRSAPADLAEHELEAARAREYNLCQTLLERDAALADAERRLGAVRESGAAVCWRALGTPCKDCPGCRAAIALNAPAQAKGARCNCGMDGTQAEVNDHIQRMKQLPHNVDSDYHSLAQSESESTP